MKKEAKGKRVVIDKETGKAKEVDVYDRGEGKKKDPEKLKAIFSNPLEHSIIPSTISITNLIFTNFRAQPRVARRRI